MADERDPDDWFDEPGPADTWAARVDRIARSRGASAEAGPADEDWTRAAAAPTGRAAGDRPRPPLVVVVLVVLGLAVLFGILAAAGVFSSSRVVTTPAITVPRHRATTTAAATTTSLPSVVPVASLKPGDTGAAVTKLQRALAQAGYSPGTIDGSYGNATTQAVSRFQQAHALAADGVAGPQTLAALTNALQTG